MLRRYPHEGLRGGFIYETLPHIQLGAIANNPEIDEIYERMHPAIEVALAELNAALRADKVKVAVSEGYRKGKTLDLANDKLEEWEVPFDRPEGWSAEASQAFEAFHDARQAMQTQMDQSIAAHADQEILYDKPKVAKDKLRSR